MNGVRGKVMKALLLMLAAVLIAPAPARSQGVIDVSRVTCKQLLASDDDMQRLIGSWIAGYFSASRNLSVVDFRTTERNTKVIGNYCRTHKSATVMHALAKNWR
jgi:acid stress chaperone HdeB